VLHELFNDIISRDIVVRHGIRSARALREMALFLVSNIGKEFSYNRLASSFGLGSANTAADFASFLEDAYIVFQVPKFSYSLRKQIANQKKAYCVDNGLSSANSASFSSDLGRLLENHVLLSLKRAGLEAFYFRGKGECDFIARDSKNSLFAFQSCLELNDENKERELSGLVEAMESLKLPSGTIVTLAQEDSFTLKGKRLRVVPAWKWKP
jgi:predicted AAA+ superfamily ATPase